MKCVACGSEQGGTPLPSGLLLCKGCGHVLVVSKQEEPTKKVRLTLEQYYVMIEELKISLQNLYLVAPPDCQEAFDTGTAKDHGECAMCTKLWSMKKLIKAVKGES